MITLANSLDPDQARRFSESKLFDIPMVFLKEFFQKVNFKKNQQTTKSMKNYPVCNELTLCLQGEPEFLGRTKCHPMVKLDPNDARTPVLQWYEITRGKEDGGELLAAFELYLVG